MASSASSYFHRYWIINSLIATLCGCVFIFLGDQGGSQYWHSFFGTLTLFVLLSFTLFIWKSWKYSISDTFFSALRNGFKISITWILIWDILLFIHIFLLYLHHNRMCTLTFNSIPCTIRELPLYDLDSAVILFLIVALLLLPILFSITGYYLDKRKNKAGFPWILPTLFFGVILFFIWLSIF